MQVSVCLGAILIPEYLDSIPEYSQTNAPLNSQGVYSSWKVLETVVSHLKCETKSLNLGTNF